MLISWMSVNIISMAAAWCLGASVAFLKLFITKTVIRGEKHENYALVLDFLSRIFVPVSSRPLAYMCIHTVNTYFRILNQSSERIRPIDRRADYRRALADYSRMLHALLRRRRLRSLQVQTQAGQLLDANTPAAHGSVQQNRRFRCVLEPKPSSRDQQVQISFPFDRPERSEETGSG